MTVRCQPLNSSTQWIQRRPTKRRRMRRRSSCRQPRLPISVPRASTAISSPEGVTRFCSGTRRPGTSAAVARLPPGLDLPPMAGVVLGHHRGDIAERDRADAFLAAIAPPLLRRECPEASEIVLTRPAKRGQALGQRERAIGALPGDAGAVEVGEERVGLAQQTVDAQAVALALQVGQMPALLDR